MKQRFIALHLPTVERLRPIAVWCARFTPFVGIEADLPAEAIKTDPAARGLILDMTGMHKIYPDEVEVGTAIRDALAKKQIPATVGIASSVGCAWALARFKKDPIAIQPMNASPASALAALPLASLRLAAPQIQSLREVGIELAGELLALPAKQLALRFGFSVLQRVDQACGRVVEPLRLLKGPSEVIASRRFDIPLTRRESLVKCIMQLLQDVFAKLETKALKASSYAVYLFTCEGDLIIRTVSLYAASRKESHVQSVIHPLVESLPLTEGIEKAAVLARDLKKYLLDQKEFIETSRPEEEESIGELFNILGAALGPEKIQKGVFHPSYIPERSFALVPLSDKSAAAPSFHERPSYLFPSPLPITAVSLLPDKPPSFFVWNQRKVKIVKGIGPERIHAAWWEENFTNFNDYRDYFKVQSDTGSWFWVFRRSEDLSWYLHGMWA